MSEEVSSMFKDAGALLEGHFLLTSGLHSPVYFEKFQVLQYPQYTQRLCQMIVDHYRNHKIEVVAGPTTGGVILAFEVARQLGVRGIFAEKDEQGRSFKRGFIIKPGERVLIVDDILTTGSSVKETIAAVDRMKGNIIGLGVLVDRSEKGVDLGYPLFSCLRSPAVTYSPASCPLCSAGIPLVKRGSSAQS
jgi:orotate phosphoribosyltransferase